MEVGDERVGEAIFNGEDAAAVGGFQETAFAEKALSDARRGVAYNSRYGERVGKQGRGESGG